MEQESRTAEFTFYTVLYVMGRNVYFLLKEMRELLERK